MHALGDRSVRDALDAVGAATSSRTAPATAGIRSRTCRSCTRTTYPRFGALDVTANAQALWACAEPQMIELTIPYLGDGAGSVAVPVRVDRPRRRPDRTRVGLAGVEPGPAGDHARRGPPHRAVRAADAEPFLPANG